MDIVTVTQEDREAAASIAAPSSAQKEGCLSGLWDAGEIVQAFARHRIAALSHRETDEGGENKPVFRPSYTAERKFKNSAGNDIQIYVSTGIAEDRFCCLTMYGPESGCENYTTWDELIQLHSALSEALALKQDHRHEP